MGTQERQERKRRRRGGRLLSHFICTVSELTHISQQPAPFLPRLPGAVPGTPDEKNKLGARVLGLPQGCLGALEEPAVFPIRVKNSSENSF